ncbi:glucosyltransferase domain-containing protein [Vitiosangium sp. GDMCC 1.1324]|uniref:glucosyltransferase domain-containing protein n=1 Tax=Vitiosangium sp. (strain GDMCC 1.1324) TaxID=2138576 RepID=UPI00130DE099|nr:glucosyltransferase domain-containing protein [Vitiosangium sp. GDMCC 1.1324]
MIASASPQPDPSGTAIAPPRPPEGTRFALPLLGALSRRELLLFASTFCLLLMTWTPRLSQTFYAGDDYGMSRVEGPQEIRGLMLGQGRFGLALVLWLQDELGAPYSHTVTLYTWMALLLMSLASVLLVRLWRLTDEGWLPFVVCPLVFIHPYFAELWAFRGMPGLACLSLVPAMLATERARLHGWKGLPGATLLLAVSFSVYQTSFNVLAAVIAVGALLALGRSEGTRLEARRVLQEWLPIACLLPLGSLCYLLVNKAVQLIFRPPTLTRTAFLDLNDAPERLRALDQLFTHVMLHDQVFSTRLLTGLQVALVVIALMLTAVQVWKQRSPTKGAWMLILSCISVLATVGLLLLLKEWWPTPRTRVAFAFAIGGHLALAYTLSGPRLRPVLVTLSSLLLWGFAGVNQQLSADQFLVNRIDRTTAQKVSFLQEQNPELRDLLKVGFVNHPYAYPGTRVDGDTNVSALAISWSHAGLMQVVTGRPYKPIDGRESALGVQECANGPKWPDERSLRHVEQLLFVCF